MRKDPRNPSDWGPGQWDEWGLDLPQWQAVKTGPQSGKGRRVIFDIEADGLLEATGAPGSASRKEEATQFWCIAAIDVGTGEEFYWGWEQMCPCPGDAAVTSLDIPVWVQHALAFLGECEVLLGHNAIGFDYPVCEKLYGWRRPEKSWDTLTIAKVIWPVDSLIGPDLARIKSGRMPGNLLKRHSLEAWGYRTGTHKGNYEGGFHEWSPAMAVYLMGDIRGTIALWRLMEKRMGWAKDTPEGSLVWPELTIETECFVQRVIFEQEKFGVRFDVAKAQALSADLSNQKADLERQLVETFGSWWQPLDDPETGTAPKIDRNVKMVGYEDITVPRFGKTGKPLAPYVGPPIQTFTADAPFVRIEWTTFNPSSRHHLGQRLQEVFGWKPKEFGGKHGDEPKVDETTLEAIPEAVMPATTRQLILDYFVVNKTLGTLAAGNKAWLKMASGPTNKDPWHVEGRIHGTMDTCGAVTRRGTHKDPNLSGTPSVRKEKVTLSDGTKAEVVLKGLAGKYGWECRELFTADTEGPFTEQTGIDASSLELIDLGHYLFTKDGGKFSDRVCDPTRDAHTEHSEICGTTRGDAKTTIYLFVYGGSAYKLSLDPGIKVTPDMIPGLLEYRGLPMLLKGLEKRFDETFVQNLDDMQKARIAHCRVIIIKLESGIEGLKDLIKDVTAAAKKGWLKSIDGSRIIVRKDYAALNSLLQSAGAISCKLWIMLFHKEMARRGYVLWRDYAQVLWVHDEIQLIHPPGMGPLLKEVGELTLKQAGQMLGLRGTYRTDGKTGRNWAECH